MNKKGYVKRKVLWRKYINHELCSTCVDPCCKKSGCDAIPLDIDPFTPEHIIEVIDKGIYSISYIKGMDGQFYPIMRSREVGAGVFNFSFARNSCALLGENGCTLSVEDRPSMALLLIPKMHAFFEKERACKQLMKLEVFIEMWADKVHIMDEVVKHYTNGMDFKTFIEKRQV